MIKKLFDDETGTFTSTIVVSGLCILIILAVVVKSIECFIPINKYFDMKETCRYTLYAMSLEGGLSSSDRTELISELKKEGLTNVKIVYPVDGTAQVKLDGDLKLRVEAEYIYSTLTGFLSRSDVTQRMVYDKTIKQKKLVN